MVRGLQRRSVRAKLLASRRRILTDPATTATARGDIGGSGHEGREEYLGRLVATALRALHRSVGPGRLDAGHAHVGRGGPAAVCDGHRRSHHVGPTVLNHLRGRERECARRGGFRRREAAEFRGKFFSAEICSESFQQSIFQSIRRSCTHLQQRHCWSC